MSGDHEGTKAILQSSIVRNIAQFGICIAKSRGREVINVRSRRGGRGCTTGVTGDYMG